MAQQYGTQESQKLYIQLSKLMHGVSRTFLQSEACANSQKAPEGSERKSTAFVQHAVGHAVGRGWFAEEALWNAMYGAACAATATGRSSSSQGSQRRQQRQQQEQQRREQARRQQDEWTRQLHRQQQYHQFRQAAAAAVLQPPADLAAAAPDVKAMSVAELHTFLQQVSSSRAAAAAGAACLACSTLHTV
jgi:hypothetical protein